MKKVLIYFPERKLAAKGGAAGYLYNLKIGLEKMKHEEFEISFYNPASVELEENQFLRSMIPKRIKDIRRVFKYANYLKRSNVVDARLFRYDAIHFHETEAMYMNRDFLSKYTGKVLLTSHAPCVPYQEIVGRLNPVDYKLFKNKIDKLIEMDRYAFERADYILFPCEEAEEPYFHTWKQYAEIRKPEKYRYIPTGIIGCEPKISKEDVRNKFGISEDNFVISFVGRHNELKGYGDLKEIGQKVLKNRKIYFLIAGREEPITGLKDEHWIEAGWTDDPHSLIAASDIFILPNRETYFDLILLEVISLGVPVVLSSTGGNKYFKRYRGDGLKFYSDIDSAEQAIKTFYQLPKEDIKKAGNVNAQIFQNNFSIGHFTKRYIDLLNDILT